jgi:transposase
MQVQCAFARGGWRCVGFLELTTELNLAHLLRSVLRGLHGDVFRTRQSSLDPYLARLDVHWVHGCRNSAELWRLLKLEGFRGSLRVVSEWTTRRRRTEKASDQQIQKVPSARTIARLMTTARDHLSKAATVTIAAIEAGVPKLVDARRLIDQFHAMIRKRIASDLDPWIIRANNDCTRRRLDHAGQRPRQD